MAYILEEGDEKDINTDSPVFHSSVTPNKRKNTDAITPNKRRKVTNEQWKSIFTIPKQQTEKKQKIKSKKAQKKTKSALPKVLKDKVYKSTANKFMKLKTKQIHLLLHNSTGDIEQFETCAELCGFNIPECKQLHLLLSTEFDGIREQSKSLQNIMFDPIAPVHYPRSLKQQWNKDSRTVLSAQKRNCLVTIHDSRLLNSKSSAYEFNKRFDCENKITTITNAQLSAQRTMAHVKGVLRLPSIKKKNNKMTSIDQTLEDIKNKNKNNNQSRNGNVLCDSIVQMKHVLNICLKELKQSETEIECLLINLRIIKYKKEKRIHIADNKINGKVLRAPELLSLFDKILADINAMKSDIKSKLDLIKNIFENKKIKNIPSKAQKRKKAKKIDAKNKAKKKRENNVTDTAGLNVAESDSNDD